MRRILIVIIAILAGLTSPLSGQDGHEIRVKIDGFTNDTLLLAVHYGQSQYIRDTALVNDQGEYVFSGDEPLASGVYLLVLPPDQNFFQVLITDEEQKFSVNTKLEDLNSNVSFDNAPENEVFYKYMNFLTEQNKKATDFKNQMEELKESDPKYISLKQDLEILDKEVKTFQDYLEGNHPNSFTTLIIKANTPTQLPEFEGTEQEVREKQWRFTQEHYFDNLDLGDSRLLRTPFLFNRVDYYINKLHVRHPDTLAMATSRVLDQMLPAEETFKYYLIHYLNSFANSKFVGMDAIYVHLVEKYYATGKAQWTDEEQLKKIVKNARELKPLLIGKVAPDMYLERKDGTTFRLHDVDSPYTVVYFWRYDCGVCKKSTPHMKEFYDNFKDRGVKIVAVCMKSGDEVAGCWDYIEENEVGDWMHAIDPYKGRVALDYSVKSTPQVYILNDKKEIISKRIAAEQMEEVMDQIIEMNERSSEGGGK